MTNQQHTHRVRDDIAHAVNLLQSANANLLKVKHEGTQGLVLDNVHQRLEAAMKSSHAAIEDILRWELQERLKTR